MQRGLPDRDLSVMEMDSAFRSRDMENNSFIIVDSKVQTTSGSRLKSVARQMNEGIYGVEKDDYDKKGVYSADKHQDRISESQNPTLELSQRRSQISESDIVQDSTNLK